MVQFGHINKRDLSFSETEERQADLFAEDNLIQPDLYKAFIEASNFTKVSILSFANNIAVDSGIVLGRLQKEGYVKYSSFNELKKQYEIK